MKLAGTYPTKGFTLIEVLLAVAIFAIVLAAINTVFYGALRLRNRTTQALDRSLPVQQVLTILKHDLQGIVPPGGTLSGTLKSGVATTSAMDQAGGTEIYTATGVIDETSPWPSVQKVSYSLRAPSTASVGGGKDLIRLVSRNLLPTTQEQVEEQWLMENVEQLQFLFYDGSQWRNTWDSTAEQTVLPKAIKVQIDLAETDVAARSKAKTPIELVVPITVYADTNQTSTASR